MEYQANLLASGPPGVRRDAVFDRRDLGGGAWVDVARNWLGGSDGVADRLVASVDWRAHRRWMYDRMVDEPRLSRWYRAGEDLPDAALSLYCRALGRHYGVRFGAVGLNFYRDGRDSVAFHSDRELRHLSDTLVAVLTLGAERPFLLRPSAGGPSVDLRPASGDLIVMGGTCQETWEHAVPKVARGAGARISASVRWCAPPGGGRPRRPPRPGSWTGRGS